MSEKVDIASAVLTLTNKIYDDVAHPALEQLGKLIALPLSFSGYPLELLMEKYKLALLKAILKVPVEKQILAKPSIAAPIIDHMKYAFEEDELLNAFSNLLASCIDMDYTEVIHPSFVEKIRQLSTFDLKVLEFVSKQLMFCFCELFVEIKVSKNQREVYPYIYLFTNIQDFTLDTQQVANSVDLLISLGVLEVDRKEIFRAEEYASRLVAFNNLGCESSFKSDLFSRYIESCTDSCLDDYEGILYNHDKFFYAIELSSELENIILNGTKNTNDFSIDTIDSTRRIIKLTAYGRHFVKAVFREDT